MSRSEESRAYHHGDLRVALISAAVGLIEESGEAAMTLRQVAKRAGVSHAAPYRHFRDRAELVGAVATEGFRKLTQELEAAIEGGLGSSANLQALGIAYVRFALEHPGHFRVMFSMEAGSGVPDDPEVDAFAVLTRVVETGQSRGEFRADDLTTQTLSAWCIVHGLASLLNAHRIGEGEAGGPGQAAALGCQVTETMLRGLGHPGGAG